MSRIELIALGINIELREKVEAVTNNNANIDNPIVAVFAMATTSI